MRRNSILISITLIVLGSAPAALGSEEEQDFPVALRWWGHAMVSIENWWGWDTVIDPYPLDLGYSDPGIVADQVFCTHRHREHSNTDLVSGEDTSAFHLFLEDEINFRGGALEFRFPVGTALGEQDRNRDREGDAVSPHLVRADFVRAFHDDANGTLRGYTGMIVLELNGVRILHCGALGQSALSREQLDQIGEVDAVCIPVGGVHTIDGPTAVRILEQLRPRVVVPMLYKTDALALDLDPIGSFIDALPEWYEVVRPIGNTVALSAAGGPIRDRPRVVLLDHEPWEMPEELAALFEAKEASSDASSEVYRPLRPEQLNHRPSNGTHTPRWNAEHTLATELLVFSSIYSEIDPAMPLINLMPAQMPPQYEPAHPDWHGLDEVMQMRRVQEFTRRFAYLLDGLPLDELPEGAPRFMGSLRGVFERMAEHYPEHAANVREKFELADWPE